MIGIWKKISRPLILSVLIIAGSSVTVQALQSSSAHYGVDQTVFSSGSVLCDPGNNGSASYCASQTLGDTAVGNSASGSFQVQAGSDVTDRNPFIEFVVSATNIDIGTLASNKTSVATATFGVKTYLASGYTVLNASDGPTNGSYTMHTLGSATAPSAGTEQFGINLVANSCPIASASSGLGSCSGALGVNPVQVPDSSFAFGQVATGYNTPGVYKYNKGDAVAFSNQSSSTTNFTISYIFNISDVTPGGTYSFNHILVATSTY